MILTEGMLFKYIQLFNSLWSVFTILSHYSILFHDIQNFQIRGQKTGASLGKLRLNLTVFHHEVCCVTILGFKDLCIKYKMVFKSFKLKEGGITHLPGA